MKHLVVFEVCYYTILNNKLIQVFEKNVHCTFSYALRVKVTN